MSTADHTSTVLTITSPAVAGTVYLVGAGPGDPGLMTARALELIASADAILHDRLIPRSALQGARPDAILEYAGKGPRGDSIKQGSIEERMVELAKQGKSVVRLKGGDPLVFGRGAEEAATLVEAGIAFEIVPGVTAGVAAAAYAGVPVTHRDHASAVAFVTGHENPEKPDQAIDWAALAVFPGTLVFYMGVRNLPSITEQLIANGRDKDEPVAVVAQGTTPQQKTVTGTLSTIAQLVADAQLQPPALTVIGPVVGERERISWFEQRPLLGRKVVVTRARAQAGRLGALLADLGADVTETPAISTQARNDADVQSVIRQIGVYDLICCTSQNGVEALFGALAAAGLDARALAGCQIAAVGKATSAAFASHGVTADFVPQRALAEGLLELLADQELAGQNILLAVAANARPTLREGLEERMANIDEIAFYDTLVEPIADNQKAAIAAAEFVIFASGSAANSTVEALGSADALQSQRLISIGPTTSAALRSHGLEPNVEATQHDVEGLVEAVVRAATS
ncbi:MAG: uroporphyrinogen-III C-methyltransferase [Thermoleophilaceae bacterium]|nr:uroporphyrinogen-III C-methyltransferase [Thermoleophilaceae bacterium]